MQLFLNDTRTAKSYACLIAASAFLLMDIATNYATAAPWDSFSQAGAAIPAGPTAMLRLRIPFGGESAAGSQPALTLSLGTAWRDPLGSSDFAGQRYTPAFEAGLALTGSPVLRLGSADMLGALGGRLNANDAANEGGGTPSWVWWTLGGVVVLGILGLALASSRKSASDRCANGGFCGI